MTQNVDFETGIVGSHASIFVNAHRFKRGGGDVTQDVDFEAKKLGLQCSTFF